MKPIYIKMRAFGSYRDELIEFDKLDGGLFLITGDTGAGKTTIFDAITFALYGKTSGGKRDGAMMRSQYAPESIKTEVTFKFLYDGAEYIVIRSPKQPNYKKLKNQERYEKLKNPLPEKVELIMPDATSYIGKKEEIDNKIKEIIGLTAEQFTQIAMLAQGDFMKLLHASSEDRKEIFAKIFDTRIYELIQKELWTLSKEIAGQLEDNKKDIIRELERVRCIGDSIYVREWEERKNTGLFRNSMEDSPLNLVYDITQEGKNKQIKIRDNQERNEKELSDLKLKMQQADSINCLFKELERFQKAYFELKERAGDIEEIKQKTEKGSNALLVEKDYIDLHKKEKILEDCKKRLNILEKWIEDNRLRLKELKLQSEKAKAEYDENSPLLLTEIEKLKESDERFKELELVGNTLIKLKNEMSELKIKLDKGITEKNHLEEKRKKLEENTDTLRKKVQNIDVLKKDTEMLENRKVSLESVLAATENYERVLQQLSDKSAEFEKAQNDEQQARQEYDYLYDEFINSQAEILRAELEEGKPCPVCGSVHFDLQLLSYEHSDIIVSNKDLNNAKNKLEKVKETKDKAYELLQQKISERDGIVYSLNNECKTLFGQVFESREKIVKEYHEVEEKLETLLKEEKEAEKNSLMIEQNENRLKELDIDLEKNTESIEANKDKQTCLMLDKKELETKLSEIKKHLPYESRKEAQQQMEMKQKILDSLREEMALSNEKYQNLLKEMNIKAGEFSTEKENLKIRRNEYSKAKAGYELSLKNHDFADTEDFRSAFVTREDLASYKETIEQYNTKVAVTQDNIKRLENETADKEPVDMDGFQEKKVQFERIKEQLQQESEKIFNVVSVNEESYLKSKKLYSTREKLNKTASVIYNVHNTANGQYSGKRIDFQTYIQRRYFKYIIDSANKRLYKMSNHQFILQCRELKDLGHRGYVGLDIDVYSIVNDQIRDVKTLSGGESFVAALSMALGMADIIQNANGKVHIDTMFIDEGFGSLSDETRNQAIEILNELSGGNRLVGIISHVTELKAQVETKLIVNKTDSGSTTQWELG